jgi:hypothetical protein
MTSSWDLGLTIDARGHDDTQVRVVRWAGLTSEHLTVRVGTVLVHCIDGAGAMSAGRAWAAARLEAEDWRPPLREPSPTARPAAAGAAYPVGSVVFEGRQPWQVRRAGDALEVVVGPLAVRAHDITALDTHIRAWAEASALAARVFPGKAVPFGQLVEHQRRQTIRALDESPTRRAPKRRQTAVPPPPPGRGQSRDRD